VVCLVKKKRGHANSHRCVNHRFTPGLADIDVPPDSNDLLNDAIDAPAQKTYTRAIVGFKSFLVKQTGVDDLDLLVRDEFRLNELGTKHINALYALWQQDGLRGPSAASTFVAALQHFHPFVRGKVKPMWRAVSSWQQKCPVKHRRAWPPMLILAMMALAALAGYPEVALMYALSFHCLLRPGEVCNFTVGDILLQDAFGSFFKELAILTIRFPKTRKRGARIQHTLVVHQG
jgi:hypothetical protein